MTSAVFLLFAAVAAVPAKTLVVADSGEAVVGASHIYPLAGMNSGSSTGAELSSHKSDYSIGDFLTELPTDAGGHAIDWTRTYAGIVTNSAGIYKSYVYCTPGVTEDTRRILFTQGGAVKMTWYFEGVADGVDVTYEVAESSSERPNRLYWTSAPFLGPTIDLTGKFVRLFGNPSVLKQTTSVDTSSGQTNVVAGIVLSTSGSSQTLEAKAQVLDADAQLYNGPSGQIVLAYFADGNMDKFLGSIVVEVGRPETKILSAHVGDELLPSGDGWSVTGLLPYPKDGKGGTETVEGDAASPHMLRGEYTRTDTGDKIFAAFALSPNDKTTRNYTDNTPSKNDIFWEKPDLMGTLWPFEEDMYNVTWNPSDATVVFSGDTSKPGIGIFVPTNYTVEVCAYQDPSGTAVADTQNANLIHVMKEGHFTLRLSTTAKAGADVWFLPMCAKSRTNRDVVNTAGGKTYDAEYHVGRLLAPLSYKHAGTATNAYAKIDSALAGYVYEPASGDDTIWNPRLYHEPVAPSKTDMSLSADSDADDDPFASLTSAIYTIAVGEKPVEVWWRSRAKAPSRLFGASSAVEYPAAVQRYKIREPKKREVREIALSSKLGSAGACFALSGQSLRFDDAQAEARLATSGLFELPDDGFTISMDLNPWAEDVPSASEEGGTVFCLATGESLVLLACDPPEEGETDTRRLHACVIGTGESAAFRFEHAARVPLRDWTTFTFGVAKDEAGVRHLSIGFGDEEAAVTNLADCAGILSGNVDALRFGSVPSVSSALAPVGFSIDNVSVRSGSAIIADWAFESDETDVPSSLALDTSSFWRALELNEGAVLATGGSSVETAEGASYGNAVVPEVYRQPVKGLTGYHKNLAHAFVRMDDKGERYVTWAVRCDLGAKTSENMVFTMFASNGKCAQAAYRVVETNAFYPVMASDTTVGHVFLPPAPLCYLNDYWNDKTSWASLVANEGDDKCIVYRDRKKNDWARRNGGGYAYYFYKPFETFDWPDGKSVQTYMPWLDYGTGNPRPWLWTATWPDDVPTMQVAQTLTKASGGLPEVWNMSSCGVIYPRAGKTAPAATEDAVDLVDPTVAQKASLAVKTSVPVDYGFTLGSSGTCQLQNGKYYFTGLPPSISSRFYIDSNAGSVSNVCLIGQLVEPATGNPYLQLNVLTAEEREALKSICKNATVEGREKWCKAVDQLATVPVRPSVKFETVADWKSYPGAALAVTNGAAYRCQYEPRDHYALMATGGKDGYVVIVENDSPDTAMVPEGNPVDVKVIRVLPTLYSGTITPLVDSKNKLSEMLTMQYNEPFGEATKDYVFEWRRSPSGSDGTVNTNYDSWTVYRSGDGLTSFTLGKEGSSLTELENTYYVMRYRAKDGTSAAKLCGTGWSAYTKYTLAEGWLQRVLNQMTPFNQRMSDFTTNEAEIRYTMLEQIGGPYVGDVALSDANLNSIGLLQLYRTVLNKAEKMSLELGSTSVGVNKQLLLAASRIADLYMLLGAEAYSDAKNPLISQGLSADYLEQLEALPSSTFCFQNQVRTLLDEELALLRGRDSSVQNPDMQTQPIFNRLIWNFTKGITEGEVAYVNNYGIRPADSGDVTVDAAAKQYPQGHGDAWGHYLSAIKGFYHLLRNPNFGWTPSMMEMMVSQSVVNEDYQEEQKFADAAVKLAQVGLDAVDLTARKAWRDNGGDLRSAYFDGSEDGQNFGYGQLASRAALGAAYNWLVVNSILPTNAASTGAYVDMGIKQITRGTATQLDELASAYSQIEDRVNRLDSGLNPLGLSQNAIPMDIDPTDLENRNTHFEQILARAEKALANCDTVLEWANKYGARLQQIQNSETEAISNQQAQELAYKNQLIAIYGTPYSGDIGPSGTYVQGYDGPDLYHYMWMDLDEFGLSQSDLEADSKSVTLTYRKWVKDKIMVSGEVDTSYDAVSQTDSTVSLKYTIAANGIVLPTVSNPGLRQTEGSIQSAYREYLTAFVAYSSAKTKYEKATTGAQEAIEGAIKSFNYKYRIKVSKETISDTLKAISVGIKTVRGIKTSTKNVYDMIVDSYMTATTASPYIMAGLAVGIDSKATVAMALMGPVLSSKLASQTTSLAADNTQIALEAAQSACEIIYSGLTLDAELADARDALASTIKSELSGITTAADNYRSAVIALQSAQAVYRAEIAKGDQLQEERATWRARVAGDAAQIRYLDMYTRIQRNNVLTKYSTAFDTAQRYVWELAKVYDYETGLLSSDPQAAGKFYAEIIGSRQLGYEGVSTSSATDKGLYDIVNRMKENFAVLKPRLGMNNPDKVSKTFSLRYELFRIDPGKGGDAAWKTELGKYWCDDINSDSDFSRFCQPLATSGALKEPGLVIPFSTTIATAKNFFNRSVRGGDHAYSSADYATKISKVGVLFVGYDKLAVQTEAGLAADPNVYLVPVGKDYLRAPTVARQVLGYNVVDQVLPLPYTIGTDELDDEDYLTTFSGLDGTSDSAAKIRRHSTLVANGELYSTRLCGRSVWNDKWLLVIPAASLNANREEGLETFIKGVSDIELGIESYSRAGN